MDHGFHRKSSNRQRVFSFVSRTERRDRKFRAAIVLVTTTTIIGIVLASAELRSWVSIGVSRLRNFVVMGMNLTESPRPLSEEEWAIRRSRSVRKSTETLAKFLGASSPELQTFFEAAGMSPKSALSPWGRGDQVFIFSSQVYGKDSAGRSYRLKPDTRSVWVRELKMQGAPHCLMLVPDRPELRRLASKAGAIVVEDSVQHTNSWGLRGAEPKLDAKVRVLVLGDSFMQGMFIGDDQTPPVQLERYLADQWKCSVNVLNTGHVGYSPEQYYHTFLEYAGRFRPHFIVISVCHNDFGEDQEVLRGKGDMYEEAAYWLNRIIAGCRSVNLGFLVVAVPHQEQIDFLRSNGHYPGHLFDFIKFSPNLAFSPLDDFINENLRIKRDESGKVARAQTSALYNAAIWDGHFSSLGSAVWAKSVGTRVTLMCNPSKLGKQFFESLPKSAQP